MDPAERRGAPDGRDAVHGIRGRTVPQVLLMTSGGIPVDLAGLGPSRTVVYVYPMTGRPGTELPEGWDEIPGARGCTSEACSFRDHFQELRAAGAAAVYGLSSQTPDYQAEAVERLHLPFDMLSDPGFQLADALGLPTFTVPARGRLHQRLTLIVFDGRVEHVFHPVREPAEHAEDVLSWLRADPRRAARARSIDAS